MDSTPLSWHTEQRTVASLIPFDGNPRQLNEKQVADLKRSLEKFNLVEIPAINTTNKILAGHQRLKIMQLLGRGAELIDVRVPNRELTPEEEREYLIRSNKNTGDWDWDALANFGADELMEWGFEAEELAKNFEIDTEEEKNEVPEVPIEARAKRGQIFTLGKHRVMCGDSTSAADVAILMDGKKADMVFTDPPYGIDYKDLKGRFEAIQNDKSLVGIEPTIRSFAEMGIPAYVCCNWKSYPNFYSILGESIKSLIVWDKETRIQNLDKFYKQHEFICYMGPFGGEKTVDGDVWKCSRETRQDHPTAKPTELCSRAISHSSNPGCFVLDLFLGSGSTLIACEKTQRVCYGMEIDPKYVDVVIARYCEQTKTDPEVIYAGAITAGPGGPGPGSATEAQASA